MKPSRSEDADFDSDDDGEMPWEYKSRERVEDALEDIRFDEVRGVVHVLTGEDHKMNRISEGFTSLEELHAQLVALADEEWYAYVPFDTGEPVFHSDSHGLVGDILRDKGVDDFFDRVSRLDGDQIYDAQEELPPGAGLIVQEDFTAINEELIRYLARHPGLLQKLTPRQLEELVAELFRDKGYDVELTPPTRDGGFDLRLSRRSDVGTILTLTECKRNAASKKVSVEVVRGLYGVVSDQKATNGLIVTTSSFTRDAIKFQRQNQHRMTLADIDVLKGWLRDHNVAR